MQLFTIHNAGGNRYAFSFLKKRLHKNISFIPLELPGRGSRMNEVLLTNIADMVDDLLEKIIPVLSPPYILIGDCMGGVIAYLICSMLIEKGYQPPVNLFIAGTYFPSRQVNKSETAYSKEYVKQMMINFGISPDLVTDSEFFELMEPIMIADIQAYTAFQISQLPSINIPVTALMKNNEPADIERAMNWQAKTVEPIKIYHINYQSQKEADRLVEIIHHSFGDVFTEE